MKTIILFLTIWLTALAAQSGGPMMEAMKEVQRSGELAQAGKFEDSHKLMYESMAEMDALVAAEPDNATLRMQRGSIYVRMPAFLNKGEMARQDLQVAAKDREPGMCGVWWS